MPNWYEDPKILRKSRKKLGLTQLELAQRAGVKRSLVANIELGRRRFTKEAQTALWDVLGDTELRIQKGVITGEDLERIKREAEHRLKVDGILAAPGGREKGVLLSSLLRHAAPTSSRAAGRQESISLNSLLGMNQTEIAQQSAELDKQRLALAKEQMANLEVQIETMKQIIEIQDNLITSGIDGPALVAEAAKKDVEIAALKQRVKDLMEMYDIGSQAVVATARYEELREKVQKPVVADDEEEPE